MYFVHTGVLYYHFSVSIALLVGMDLVGKDQSSDCGLDDTHRKVDNHTPGMLKLEIINEFDAVS